MRSHATQITLIVLLLMLQFVLTSAPAQGQTETPKETPGLDVIILVDESETMWNKTDTAGVRVNTVNYLIDILASEQSGQHRAGIVAFGTGPEIIPLTLLDTPAAAETLKQQYAAVHQSIRPRKDVQYTDINRALQSALEMLAQDGDPNRKAALIMLSDGQPTTRDVSEKEGEETVLAYLSETRRLLGQLQQYPYTGPVCGSPTGAPLHIIGMGVDKLSEASTPEFIELYREFWQESAANSQGYYKEAARIREMQGIGTYIFAELLCTPATPAEAVRGSQVLEYQVFENYYQIFFTISGKENPDLEARVFRPKADGSSGDTPLSEAAEGVSLQRGPDYEVWGIRFTEPWAGTWRVKLEGEGRAEFSYVFFPKVSLQLAEPNNNFLPVDKPFTIRAKIVDEQGRVVDIPVKDFQAEVERDDPEGTDFRQQFALEPDGDSFAAQLEPLAEKGEYALTLSALLPDGTPLYEHQWVTLISAPWVEVAKPEAPFTPDQEIPLTANVHLAGALSPESAQVVATLLKDNAPLQSIELSQNDSRRADEETVVNYTGTFPPVEASGKYNVQVKLMAILPGGRVFNQTSSPVPLSVLLPPSATPSPTSSPAATPTATSTSTHTPTPVPTATPTLTPTTVPFFVAATNSPWCWPGLLLLLLLLIVAALLGGVWRKRRQEQVPAKIQFLAGLMQSRRENEESPYVLVLGSGPAVSMGSSSMQEVVYNVAGTRDLDKFHKTLDGLSGTERYLLLKKYFDSIEPSDGYRRLAELVKKGYFNVILSTNLDPFVEEALAAEKVKSVEVIVCGNRRGIETVDIPQDSASPVRVVKLHGDVETRAFAFTPSEITVFGSDSEPLLRAYLAQDVIIIGHGSRDYDINRAISREGGAIWYVGQSPPATDDSVYQAMRARKTQDNMITGEFGWFDHFFEALYEELMRS